MSLRGMKKIPSLCSEQAAQSDGVVARREASKQSHPIVEIATLPSVARDDNVKP